MSTEQQAPATPLPNAYRGAIVPETPLMQQGEEETKQRRQNPDLNNLFHCAWCHIPLADDENESLRRQCFICGFAVCPECLTTNKGKVLVNIGRRYICDECTRDLVTHMEPMTSEPIKRFKKQKRWTRLLSSRGQLYVVKRSVLD